MPRTSYPHAAHHPDQPILEVMRLSVQYDHLPALENITFHLHTGERVAVVGPNGAGKSTLLKVIAGVLPPTGGEVNIYGSGPTAHICIAYVPQRSQVDWGFPVNVADAVMMGRIGRIGLLRQPASRDWEHIHRSLETVGLAALEKRQIGELSGGQQQRVFIARALAQEAELILMDEPFTGLDAPSQQDIFDILETLRAQKVTVMISLHDLKQATDHFERIMLLNRRLIAYGPAESALTTEHLAAAYGSHLHLTGEEGLLISDTCCEGGEHV
ncbi:MAG: metal ABC transporter ATP-binding protein [Chloroflexi bacterium]|nr:metal ABC transporter ATP-binding protein [Chloroflexota bacterium]